MAGRHDDYLLIRLQEVCNSVPLDPKRSWGPALCELARRTSKQPGDHAAFYMEFMEGIRDLLDNDEEDQILRRFLDQSMASEPRIHADNRDIRDHLTHVTQVFLTGWIILNSCPVFTRPDMTPYDWTKDRVLENLNRCWLYAALLHDCAYSVEYAKKALGHELAVRNLFHDTYLPGTAGASNADGIKSAANYLWQKRSQWRNVPCEDLHEKQYTHPDHGIVGAIALWKEADGASAELRSILEPAALAIACHNFQYLVEDNPKPTCKADWLRLSLKREPISVLLHICDELQEWGRERIDEAMIYKHVFKPLRYAATELTRLDVHGHDGLGLNVRLLRRLYPEHRPLRHRIAREQERALAKTARSFERLFGYCADADEEGFHVRLRVQQTVDDVRCKQELRVDWLSTSHNVLKDLHEDAKKRYEGSSPQNATLEEVAVQQMDSADPLLWIESGSGKGWIRLPEETTLSVVILAAGAAGKSTLLRSVAYNPYSTYRALYIEQLPEEPTDIQDELNALAPAVLIVDHLDRLVEDETTPFWLEQISTASKIKGLHIVLASRTEEYKRYFQASLQGFKSLEWNRKDPLLVKDVQDPADDNGRLRAHAIESRCKDDLDFRSIALLAKDMGQRRAVDLPRDVNTRWKGDFETRTGKQPIVSHSPSGKARFLHDCLQDFFSAIHIVQCLSGEPTASPGVDVMAVRQLERLPRDVVRLLFDLLASEDTTLLSKETKEKAALRLASAFIEEPTIQQWLYDTGRLQQARHAIDEYHKRYSGIPEVDVVARKFLGHIEYENFNVNDEGTYRNAHRAFRNWFKAALAADDLLKDPNKNALTDRYQWFLAFLVDHLFLVLTRFAGIGSAQSGTVREWLRSEGLKSGTATDVLQPGWISSLLEQLGSAASQPDTDKKFWSIDDDLTKVRASSSSSDAVQPLDVRRAHLASHLGNHFLGEGYKPKDKGKLEPTRLNRAGEYFQRSISRRERVLREMEREPFNLRGVEVFSTLCQGYADNAHQYRGVFECLFLSHKYRKDLGNLAVELIQAHRLQEAKWAQARLHRRPSERLPNMFRTSLPWLATGRALTELVESLAADAIRQDEVQDSLRKEEQRLLNDYRQEGEVHARNAANDLAQKSVFGDESKHVAAVLKIAKAGAELLSGGKQKS